MAIAMASIGGRGLLVSFLYCSHHRAAGAFSSANEFLLLPAKNNHRQRLLHNRNNNKVATTKMMMMSSSTTSSSSAPRQRERISDDRIFFIELGFGNDSHGQSSTKAAVRACRNAIEFNSIPSIRRLIPDGGYDALKLDVILAVPPKYREGLDLTEVAKVFPYGDVRFELQDGGMVAPSGIAIEKLGDVNDDMVVVCASVTVGH